MRLENWFVIHHATCISLQGNVYGNPRFEDGTEVRTSPIQGKRNGAAVTMNSVYELGEQDKKYIEQFPEDSKDNFLESLKEI
jgi:hypothetical protein